MVHVYMLVCKGSKLTWSAFLDHSLWRQGRLADPGAGQSQVVELVSPLLSGISFYLDFPSTRIAGSYHTHSYMFSSWELVNVSPSAFGANEFISSWE